MANISKVELNGTTYIFKDSGSIPTSAKGAANGVASLDSSGKVPSSQLPSYVDDVLEYSAKSSFPATGETGKIYVDTSNNKTYRWSGSAYVEISASLALGETSSTAYRGDRGKTAYDHSQTTSGNPHNVTKSDVGLGNVGNFKAVSTVASQGLSDTEKSNARSNIGAGTGNGTYSKPSGGIPKTDLASGVQASLDLADSALQSHQTIKQDGITGATVNRFGTCSTAAATAAKTVSVTSGTFSLEAGARVTVKFTNANTAGTPTLNVNSKGAKNIFSKGAQITTGSNKSLLAGTVDFIYDGTQWHLIGNYIDTNTTYSNASTSAAGLMSATDKKKLNGIAEGANNYTHPTSAGNKHIPSGGSSGKVLIYGGSSGTASWGDVPCEIIDPADFFTPHSGGTIIEHTKLFKQGKHIFGFIGFKATTGTPVIGDLKTAYLPATRLFGVEYVSNSSTGLLDPSLYEINGSIIIGYGSFGNGVNVYFYVDYVIA